MHVVLDLWGVLLDSEKMNLEYNKRAARILALRFDGDKQRWLKAYDDAWASYARRLSEADWDREDWLEIVDELDRALILETFEAIGIDWRPSDILAYSRDLESQVASFVASSFDEVQAALTELRKAGHKVLVATQVGLWNARPALNGSGLARSIDGLYTGDKLNAHKTRRGYWRKLLDSTSLQPSDCIAVDDRLDCLAAAGAEQIKGVLMDRGGRFSPQTPPSFATTRISSLTELLPLLEKNR